MNIPQILIGEDDYRWIRSFRPEDFGLVTQITDVASGLRAIVYGETYEYAIFDKSLAPGDLEELEDVNSSGMLLAWAFTIRFPGKRVVVATGALKTGFGDDVPPMLHDLVRSRSCLYIYKYDHDADNRIRRFLKGEPPEVNYHLLDSLILQPTIMGFGIDLKLLLKKLANKFRGT